MDWTEFHLDDPETHPPLRDLVLVWTGYGYVIHEWVGDAWYDSENDLDDGWQDDDVVWWQPLPKPPPGGED